MQTFQPSLFIPAMLMGAIDSYNFMPVTSVKG